MRISMLAYRCYRIQEKDELRRKNDNGRKWRAHRSFNPSARLLQCICKLGLEENSNFHFNATIAISTNRYNSLYDRIVVLSKEERFERWGFRQSMSWVNVQRVQVGASTGEKKRGQSIPTGWSLFFRPRCRVSLEKERQKSLSLSLPLPFSLSISFSLSLARLGTESEGRPDLV